jgi:hypothetical protein
MVLANNGGDMRFVRAKAALDQYFNLLESTRKQQCAPTSGPEIERESWRRRFANT